MEFKTFINTLNGSMPVFKNLSPYAWTVGKLEDR